MANDWAFIKANDIQTEWGKVVEKLNLPMQCGQNWFSLNGLIAQALREAYQQGRRDENEACMKLAHDQAARFKSDPCCGTCGHVPFGSKMLDSYQLGCRDAHNSDALLIGARMAVSPNAQLLDKGDRK